jgi:hypothetical protein
VQLQKDKGKGEAIRIFSVSGFSSSADKNKKESGLTEANN